MIIMLSILKQIPNAYEEELPGIEAFDKVENYEDYGVARGRWSDTGSEWDDFTGSPVLSPPTAPSPRVTFNFQFSQSTPPKQNHFQFSYSEHIFTWPSLVGESPPLKKE